MLVEQLEALQSIQETYIAMNESTHDLSNVKTDTLTSLHALHAKEPKGTRSYDQRQRVAAELKKRGIKVQEDVMDEKFAHPNHKKLDANDNGKVDAQDFALLRKKKGMKNFKEFKESLEQLDEGTNIPVSRATDAVSKVLGQKGAVNFLAKLKPGNKTHTSWNEVNGALVDQGTQSAHIAKVAGHLKPTQYNEAED